MNQQTPLNLREERDFGQKLNATFAFIGQNLKPLFKAILIIGGPFLLIGGALTGAFQSSVLRTATQDPREVYDTYGQYTFANDITFAYQWIGLLFSLVGGVLITLTIYSYIVEYMDHENTKPSLGQVWERVKEHLVTGVLSAIGLSLMVGIAFIFLLIPGIYISVPLSMFFIVMVREQTNFVETIERCFKLIKGNWWATFGFLIVVGIIQYVAMFIAQMPMLGIIAMRTLAVPVADSDFLMVAITALSTLITYVFYVFMLVAIAMQYFNLVEQREGIGYMEEINQIGNTATGEHGF